MLGADGRPRCFWGASTPEYMAYHDTEWGRPVRGDDALFERMTLEAFQSGLAWITILRKRAAFRRAFDGFAIDKVAAFSEADADPADGRRRHRPQPDEGRRRAAQRPGRRRSAGRPGRAALVVRAAAAATPGLPGRGAGHHAGVHGDGQGPEEARLQVRRAHHGVRADAGHRHGRRPHRGLLRPTRQRDGRRRRDEMDAHGAVGGDHPGGPVGDRAVVPPRHADRGGRDRRDAGRRRRRAAGRGRRNRRRWRSAGSAAGDRGRVHPAGLRRAGAGRRPQARPSR